MPIDKSSSTALDHTTIVSPATGRPLGIGVIGCGMVSHAYLGSIARSPSVELRGLASRTHRSAELQASRYGGMAMSVDDLLADPSIDIVVNLAPPAAHHDLSRRTLDAGKHLYSEKPFAVTLEQADDLLRRARANGLLVGCAPDTFLGDGHQRARRLIDEGKVGAIVGGSIAFGSPGMEGWHPDPAAFFKVGGGPLLDVGPYYVTQLVNLLGPVAEVVAIGSTPHAQRIATGIGREGERIDVQVFTTAAGALRFASGAIISLAMSWDVQAHRRPPIELYGTGGTLSAPDPNQFAGANSISTDGREWHADGTVTKKPRMAPQALSRAVASLMAGVDPVTGGGVDKETTLRLGDHRGIGLIDMADGIVEGREPRASGELAYHVLETLLGLEQAVLTGTGVAIGSRPARPLPVSWVA